ncbi:MAG: hypothetical protein JW795_08775 [Chitinivibrionales bacterium]|nr:hypothetical protein [Chitinivibrionales bacterium]
MKKGLIAFVVLVVTLSAVVAQSGKPIAYLTDQSVKAGETVKLKSDTVYVLTEKLFVEDGAKLYIEPGTVIKGQYRSTPSLATAIFICRGAQIFAEGTKEKPIIMTSEQDNVDDPDDLDGMADRGLWGGVVIAGRAPINEKTNGLYEDVVEGVVLVDPADKRAYYGPGIEDYTEANSPKYYNDNSGVFRYVSIRHSGAVVENGKELNGLTLCGVGAGTTIEYVESYASADDAFEWFGGTVNCKYLAAAFANDDCLDYDQGFRGKIQFFFAIQDTIHSEANCIGEWDGDDTPGAQPWTQPTIANFTGIGCGTKTGNGGNNWGIIMRANAGGHLFNSSFSDVSNVMGFILEDDPIAKDSKLQMDLGNLTVKNNVWFRVYNQGTKKMLTDLKDILYIFDATEYVLASSNPSYQYLIDTFKRWNNEYVDPLYRGVSWSQNFTSDPKLDPRPQPGSPLLTKTLDYPSDGFFTQVNFRGAFNTTNNWMAGWTGLWQNRYLSRENFSNNEITDQPSDESVNEREHGRFSIVVNGNAGYQWYKNGVAIPGAVDATYAFTATLDDNGAVFSCVATFIDGEPKTITSRNATLTVIMLPPGIVVQPQNVTVPEGEKANFSIEARGSKLRYQWRKNNSDLPNAQNSAYTTEPVTMQDANALFSCVVSNDAGTVVSAEAELAVAPGIPVIEAEPVDVSTQEKTSVTFAVKARGLTLAYGWYANDVAIQGANTDSYTFTAQTTDNGKQFHCVVTNALGTKTTRKALLTVGMKPPKILVQPLDQTISVGGVAEFALQAEGTLISYQWYKNGEKINMTEATEPLYRTPAATLADDQTRYFCVVTNTAGSDTSRVAVLTVADEKPEITTHPQNSSVAEGDSAIFTVNAKGSNLHYQWSRGAAEIAGATSPVYVLRSVSYTADNNAEFSCRVWNTKDAVISGKALLTVRMGAPIITAHPQDITIEERKTALFFIAAQGLGITYRWFKDGVVMPNEINDTLKIDGVRFINQGVYTCRVFNSALDSVISHPASLTVTLAAPVITVQPQNSKTIEGFSGTFAVSAEGSDSISYQWKKNGENVAGATQPVYTTVAVTKADDSTKYSCIVYNSKSSVESTVALLLISLKPVVISKDLTETITADERSPVTLSIEAAGTDVVYQWQKNEFDLTGETQSSYTIPSASLDDNGKKFRCVAWNTGGGDTSKNAVLVVRQKKPEFNTPLPPSSSVVESQSVTLTVDVVGSVLRYRWLKTGVEIQGANSASYTIPAASVLDDGVYLCEVSNDAGVIQTETRLTVVLLSPVITQQPVNAAVTEFEKARFAIVATGTNISYQWLKNGVEIAGATYPNYETEPAGMNDEGTKFSCKVVNSREAVLSNEATLTVRMAPPTIKRHPSSRNVIEDAVVTFSVAAQGTARTYQWLRGETPIDKATDSAYTLTATMNDDNAAFSCVIKNEGGEKRSDPAILRVQMKEPEITQQPVSASAMEGTIARFEVTAKGTEITYQWYRNGQPIQDATASVYETQPVNFVTDQQVGFQCKVTNRAAVIASAIAYLKVTLAPPVITEQPQNVQIADGKSASFSIKATGTGVSYQWYKNDALIPGATGSGYTTGSLTMSDNGAQFHCTVKNAEYSVASQKASVTITATPIANKQELPKNGETITILAAPAVIDVNRSAATTIVLRYSGVIRESRCMIYDAMGNCLFQQRAGRMTADNKSIVKIATWNATSLNGRSVGSGTYLAVVAFKDEQGIERKVKTFIGVKK